MDDNKKLSQLGLVSEWAEGDRLYLARSVSGVQTPLGMTVDQLPVDLLRRRSISYARPSNATVWNFDDHTDYTVEGNFSPDPTLSTDTTEHPGTNNASVKVAVPVVPAGSGTKQWRVVRDFVSPVDIRECTITVRYYCDATWRPQGDACEHSAFYIEMSDKEYVRDAVGGRRRWSLPLSPGWHTIELTTAWGSDVRTPDLSAIRSMCFSYSPNSTGGNDEIWNLWLDYIMFTPSPRATGGVIIAFDDGFADCLEAAKLLHSYGFRSMVFAMPDKWSTGGDYATVAQLHQCQDYGMLVCAHNNGTYFDRVAYPHVVVDDEDVHEYCREIKRRMLEQGFHSGADFYAFTGGTSRIQSEDHVSIFRKYFAIVRGTGQLRTQGMEPFRLGAHVDGPAINKGGGLVGIPTPDGHSIKAGWQIGFQGTSTYYPQGTWYTVSSVSDYEVVISATYQAYTFADVSITPRTTNAILGTGQTIHVLNPASPQEPWWRYGFGLDEANDATWLAWHTDRLDSAIATKSVFELYYHDSTVTGWTLARLAALCDAIRTRVDAGTLEVMTYEDLVS